MRREWKAYSGILGYARWLSRPLLVTVGNLYSTFALKKPFLARVCYWYLHAICWTVTLRIVGICGWTLAFDVLSYMYFWTMSISHRYDQFCGELSTAEARNAIFEKLAGIPPWHHRSRFVDLWLSIIIFCLSICVKPPTLSSTSTRQLLRKRLTLQPPSAPLSSHDFFWLQDTPENRCQVVGLAITDPLSIEELRELVFDRWVRWDPKFISLTGYGWGRACWTPQSLHRTYQRYSKTEDTPASHFQAKLRPGTPSGFPIPFHSGTTHGSLSPGTNPSRVFSTPQSANFGPSSTYPRPAPTTTVGTESDASEPTTERSGLNMDLKHGTGELEVWDGAGTFDICQHVYEVEVDTMKKTMHEALSEFASQAMPRDRPLWRLILMQPSGGSLDPTPSKDETTLRTVGEDFHSEKDGYSCLCLQFHHGMADGIGISFAVTNRLFDPCTCQDFSCPAPSAASRRRRASSRPKRDEPGELSWACEIRKGLTASMYYGLNVLKCGIYGLRVMTFWAFWCPYPPALFSPPAESPSMNPSARPLPTGHKHLSPPATIPLEIIQEIREAVEKIGGFKPTLNDVIACCITLVVGKLRSGEVVQELRSKIQKRRRNAGELRNTSTGRRSIKIEGLRSICEGVSIDPPHLDLATPTAYQPSLPQSLANPPSLRPGDSLTGFYKTAHVEKASAFYGLSSAVSGQMLTDLKARWDACVEGLLLPPDPCYTPAASNFEDFVQLMIPMTTRTGVPGGLDNFTGTVLVRLPLLHHTQNFCGAYLLEGSCRAALPPEAFETLLTLKHLLCVKREIDAVKRKDLGPVFFLLTCLSAKVLPAFLTRVAVTGMSNRMQFTFTSIVGPQEGNRINGKKIKSIQFWPPAKGEVTAGISVMSYEENLLLFLAIDEAELNLVDSTEPRVSLNSAERARAAQLLVNMVKSEVYWMHRLIMTNLQTLHT